MDSYVAQQYHPNVPPTNFVIDAPAIAGIETPS
jgi:hypothetical protein